MNSSAVAPVHSAVVNLQLDVAGAMYELAQIGPNDIIFSEPTALSPCEAQVVMHVDGTEHRWRVTLPNGASTDDQRTPIAREL